MLKSAHTALGRKLFYLSDLCADSCTWFHSGQVGGTVHPGECLHDLPMSHTGNTGGSPGLNIPWGFDAVHVRCDMITNGLLWHELALPGQYVT